jgi:hypothetical protein
MTSKERDLIQVIGHLLDAVKDLQATCSSLNEMISERLPDLTASERDILKNDSRRFVALAQESARNSDFFNLLAASVDRLDEGVGEALLPGMR